MELEIKASHINFYAMPQVVCSHITILSLSCGWDSLGMEDIVSSEPRVKHAPGDSITVLSSDPRSRNWCAVVVSLVSCENYGPHQIPIDCIMDCFPSYCWPGWNGFKFLRINRVEDCVVHRDKQLRFPDVFTSSADVQHVAQGFWEWKAFTIPVRISWNAGLAD